MIFSTGTVNSYLKNLTLQQKWQQKKQSLGMIQPQPTIKSLLQQQMEKNSMGTIVGKLAGGKKLSADEMDYLRRNHPDLYAKALQITTEREDYGRELKRCKTKDDVRRAHMNKMISLKSDLDTAGRSGDDNTAFDSRVRQMHICDEYYSFLNSKEYVKLRWEHEEAAIAAQKKKTRQLRNKTQSLPSLALPRDEVNLYTRLNQKQILVKVKKSPYSHAGRSISIRV